MKFTVFPNPLIGNQFKIRFPNAEPGQLIILDNGGHEIKRTEIDGFNSEITMEFENGADPGIYVINFVSVKSRGTAKLIKK